MSDLIPYGTLRDIANELKNIREILEKQLTTEQSSEVEEWIKIWSNVYTCSNCKVPKIVSELKPVYNYCPHCGAKMKEVYDE